MKSLKVLLAVMGVLFFTNISLAHTEKEPAQGKNILLYVTRDYGSPPLRLAFDEDLPFILAQECFAVTVEDRQSLPTLSAAILENYDQLWFVSTEGSDILTTDEIQAILSFHNAGKGIMVIGDGCSYDVPANQFSESLGVYFYLGGSCDWDHCGGSIGCPISTSDFISHEIWHNVSSIQANLNEGYLIATSPASIIATNNGINMVAVLDTSGGRVAWDATWYRFTDSSYYPDASIRHFDNAQYTRNLANWLARIPSYTRGDANGDSAIDIGDVVYLINYLFKNGQSPDPFKAGDASHDCLVDIADVVYLINYLFKGGLPPSCEEGSLSSSGALQSLSKGIKTATVSFQPTKSPENGFFEIPVAGNFVVDVAGVQLEISYDPKDITLLEPSLSTRTEGLQLYSDVKDGVLKIGILDMSGQNYIAPGEGPLVTLRAQGNDLSSLVIKEAILVDKDANKIPVEIVKSISTTENQSVPQEFTLSQNIPNPFNPETEISYVLPSACPVKLSIYNLLGEKVRTLVDGYQTTGHKTVRWDGADDLGNKVASGVYFYKLKAGEFTETKKMIMMK